jgi:hypothetical protein
MKVLLTLLLCSSVMASAAMTVEACGVVLDRIIAEKRFVYPSWDLHVWDQPRPPFTVQIEGKVFEFDHILSLGSPKYQSSSVYRTSDSKHIIKLYPFSSRSSHQPPMEIVTYEYFATKFLLEKGEPVLDIVAPPTIVEVQGHKYLAVVKPYLKGVRDYEIEQGRNVGLVLIIEDGALKSAINKITKYFRKVSDENVFDETPGEFEVWLAKNFVNLWGDATLNMDIVNRFAKMGDFRKPGNWLYTVNGWILIDP